MKPVLLLHGALGAKTQLEGLRKRLEVEYQRDVHTLNFSGHGGLPFSPFGFGIEAFADEVINVLARIGSADIFGYSMGGYVALWVAQQLPLKVASVTTLGTKFDWNVQTAEKEARKMNANKISEKIPSFARLLESRHAPNDWKELIERTADMMLILGAEPLLTIELLKRIEVPVTIALGDQDDMAERSYSEEVAGHLPHGKFVLLEKTPHPIEKTDLSQILNLFKHP